MRKLINVIAACLLLATGAYVYAQLAPVPPLPDTERRTEYAGVSNSTGPFSVGFALYGDGTDYQNWIQVYVNGLATTDYTMASASGVLGSIPLPITNATITFNHAVTGTVEVVGARRPRRLSQLSENRPLSAHDFNLIVTDILAQMREGWDTRTQRTVQVPPGDTQTLLPPKAQRVNQSAVFDANGNLTAGLPVSGGAIVSAAMQPVVACSTIACAQGLLGVTAVPIATVVPFAGLTPPAGFDFAAGQAYNRTTFATLLAALTSSQNGTCTNGSTTISGLTDTSQFGIGMRIEGSAIPSLTNTIASIVSGTSVTVTGAATATGPCTVKVYPYGNGDGLTTFNLPDYRSVSVQGRGNMNGADRGLVSAANFGASPTALGVNGGSQNHTMLTTELVAHNHPVFLNEPTHTHQYVKGSNSGQTYSFPGGGGALDTTSNVSTGTAQGAGGLIGITVRDTAGGGGTANQTAMSTGGGQPFPIMPPRVVSNYIIRVQP